MLGRNTPPGTAVPNAAIIATRWIPAHAPNARGLNPYAEGSSHAFSSSPIDNIHWIARFGLEKSVVATSFTSPGGHKNRTPKSSSTHPGGGGAHFPIFALARNRSATVATLTSAHSNMRQPLRLGEGRIADNHAWH